MHICQPVSMFVPQKIYIFYSTKVGAFFIIACDHLVCRRTIWKLDNVMLSFIIMWGNNNLRTYPTYQLLEAGGWCQLSSDDCNAAHKDKYKDKNKNTYKCFKDPMYVTLCTSTLSLDGLLVQNMTSQVSVSLDLELPIASWLGNLNNTVRRTEPLSQRHSKRTSRTFETLLSASCLLSPRIQLQRSFVLSRCSNLILSNKCCLAVINQIFICCSIISLWFQANIFLNIFCYLICYQSSGRI